jgi:tetratricopeptide (TPR) repeat protein
MKKLLALFLLVLLACGVAAAETKESRDKLEKARRELQSPRRNLLHVEKLIQDSLKSSPDFLEAQRALADLYYLENRFDSAAAEYLKARALDDSQKKLSRADRNLLLDGLGLSQAQGRHYDEAIASYKAAIAEDPEYALFEYNLACTYAMKGDLDSALPHLTKSWELRDSLPNGVEFPDPRKDDSFKRYWNDSRFTAAVENIVV